MKEFVSFLLCAVLSSASALDLGLPTDNRALLEGNPQDYYMHTNRYVDGKNVRPWSAGQYGYVRNLRNTKVGVIATKFHEGIDVKPIYRDARNRPLDKIYSIADGTVVYVNNSSSGSNYGKYIVVQHDWGDGPLYSLYSHLAETSASVGTKVRKGATIGIMGYTGRGLDRERAHLHMELCFLLSDRFDDWVVGTNRHGLFHGHNLAGLDIASLYLSLQANPKVTLPQFQAAAVPYYKVTVPRKHPLQIATRYPWLKKGDHATPSPSWEISFSDSGLPLAVTPSNRTVEKATISYIRPTAARHEFFTSGRVVGSGRSASLSKRGRRYLDLITLGPKAP